MRKILLVMLLIGFEEDMSYSRNKEKTEHQEDGLKGVGRFSQRSLSNLVGVHPDLVTIMHESIKETPIDFTITEGVRTAKRQRELYAQGRTLPGNIVTYADGWVKKSNHQPKSDGYGYAVDLYPCINGKVNVHAVDELKVIADHICKVAQSLGIYIVWGGNWKMRDYSHFEVKG